MRDFTHHTYRRLLWSLTHRGYSFFTFGNYEPDACDVVPMALLRHDVDRMPQRALHLAAIEHAFGISSTFFFRTKPISYNRRVIKKIAAMNHEIGYHYEDLSDAKGDYKAAWNNFKANLRRFNDVGGVQSIAMHGRPLSAWDNRLLWQRYDYRRVGIRTEAYIDIDWRCFEYFTDVGRSWDNSSNIRDHAVMPASTQIRSSWDLISLITNQKPNVIISTHPERWTNSIWGWTQVLFTDLAINAVKRVVASRR